MRQYKAKLFLEILREYSYRSNRSIASSSFYDGISYVIPKSEHEVVGMGFQKLKDLYSVNEKILENLDSAPDDLLKFKDLALSEDIHVTKRNMFHNYLKNYKKIIKKLKSINELLKPEWNHTGDSYKQYENKLNKYIKYIKKVNMIVLEQIAMTQYDWFVESVGSNEDISHHADHLVRNKKHLFPQDDGGSESTFFIKYITENTIISFLSNFPYLHTWYNFMNKKLGIREQSHEVRRKLFNQD